MIIDKIIIKYLKNSSNKDENEFLLNWLNLSSQNREQFFQIKDIWDTSALYENKFDVQKNWSRLNIKPISSSKLKIKLYKKIISIAAVALLAIGVYIFMPKQYLPNRSNVALNVVSTFFGQKVHLVLSDGTSVWLNSQSKFSYPSHFTDTTREVYLSGEGYFEVAKNSEKQFIIKTSDLDVKVIGTKFNLSAYDNDETIETSLFSGKVKISLNKLDGEFVLAPKQKAIYDKKLSTFKIISEKNDFTKQWINNKLSFSDIKLSNIIRKLERKYNYKITIKNKDIRNVKFSGEYENESIEEILDMFKYIIPIDYEKITANEIIIDKI